MASVPIYILNKSVMPQLRVAMQKVSLDLQEMGSPKSTEEGTEQDWKCCDKLGDFFHFGTCEVNDKNGLHLKAGTFCIIPGPGGRDRKRKDITVAFKHFESALKVLGAHQMPYRGSG